jgi:hypothetical protein
MTESCGSALLWPPSHSPLTNLAGVTVTARNLSLPQMHDGVGCCLTKKSPPS